MVLPFQMPHLPKVTCLKPVDFAGEKRLVSYWTPGSEGAPATSCGAGGAWVPCRPADVKDHAPSAPLARLLPSVCWEQGYVTVVPGLQQACSVLLEGGLGLGLRGPPDYG